MHPKRIRRRVRLYLAPPGSRMDALLRSSMRLITKARQKPLASILVMLLPAPLARRLRLFLRRRKVAALSAERAEALEIRDAYVSQARPVIIFPPSLDWNTQLFQRPQQLALALARQGALVFYLQPHSDPHNQAFKQIGERIYLCNTLAEAFDDFESPLVYLLTWNRTYRNAFRDPRVIYDYVDDIQVFEGNYRSMLRDHEMLVSESHLVLTTAERLYNQTLPLRKDAILCPNGVDYDHFAASHHDGVADPPADLVPILETGQPIIGYYGALAAWFDYKLVGELAARRGDLQFVLIGPDYDGTIPPDFLDSPNIHWLGVKNYQQLPGYLRYFRVAMIPFLLNEITHATSPLKLFEYMAGGKPVIITPMHESMRYEGVLVADTAASFSQQIDAAIQALEDPSFMQLIDRVARQNTWEARAEQILAALSSKTPQTP